MFHSDSEIHLCTVHYEYPDGELITRRVWNNVHVMPSTIIIFGMQQNGRTTKQFSTNGVHASHGQYAKRTLGFFCFVFYSMN